MNGLPLIGGVPCKFEYRARTPSWSRAHRRRWGRTRSTSHCTGTRYVRNVHWTNKIVSCLSRRRQLHTFMLTLGCVGLIIEPHIQLHSPLPKPITYRVTPTRSVFCKTPPTTLASATSAPSFYVFTAWTPAWVSHTSRDHSYRTYTLTNGCFPFSPLLVVGVYMGEQTGGTPRCRCGAGCRPRKWSTWRPTDAGSR